MLPEETSCTCTVCKKMCQTRPCWPIPEEAERLIEVGYAADLMLDWWILEDGHRCYIVSPAIRGYGGKIAPKIPLGRCSMLHLRTNLCLLHTPGLKPLEGRLAHHSHGGEYNLHQHVADLWNTDKGREVVSLWEKAVKDLET